MKRVDPNGDVKIYLSDIKGITANFICHFYTTNKSFCIVRTMNDLEIDLVDGVVMHCFKLNWSELEPIGRGVLNVDVMLIEQDFDFNDDYFNPTFTRTLDYYINSPVVVDDDDEQDDGQSRLDELQQQLNADVATLQGNITSEATARQQADANLQTALTGKANVGDSYTKAQSDAKYLTQHQSLDGYATQTWVESQGYLTEHQDISSLATKGELAAEATARQTSDSTLQGNSTTVSNNLSALQTELTQQGQTIAASLTDLNDRVNALDEVDCGTYVET